MSLKDRLVIHEGLRLKPYTDTQGKLTIGVGRNLTDDGITEAEAFAMLDRDISLARTDADTFPWFETLDSVRQDVVVEMVFNMGLEKLHGFQQTLAAIAKGDYHTASAEMMNSLWAKEVGNRAMELSKMMWSGTE